MHHPRSISAARRLRIAALLLLGNRLLVLIAGGLLLFSLTDGDHRLMILGSGLVIVSFMLTITQWLVASHAGCPLCRTPVLAPMKCMKHRHAKSFLGSYRLRVAVAIACRERFRCPYCNEPTAMEVVERMRGSRPRGSQMTEI